MLLPFPEDVDQGVQTSPGYHKVGQNDPENKDEHGNDGEASDSDGEDNQSSSDGSQYDSDSEYGECVNFAL